MKLSSNCPYFLLQLTFLNASCFMRQMVVQFTLTSFKLSLLFTHELKIKSVSSFERARSTRRWLFILRAHLRFLVFRFQIRVIFLSSFFLSLSQVGDEIRSCALRVSRQLLTPKSLGVSKQVTLKPFTNI